MTLKSCIENLQENNSLREAIDAGYKAIFEEITEPMQYLKNYVKNENSLVSTHAQAYMNTTRKSVKEATEDYDIAYENWHWFSKKINEVEDYGINEDEQFYEDEEKNNAILFSFMNEYPREFSRLVDRYSSDIEPGITSKVMDYEKPLINKWFVHFSNNGWEIFFDGFKFGNEDPSRLALTDAGNTKGKHGDYLFAFDANDADKYGRGSRYRREKFKYGDKAVVFIGSGLKFYHSGDEEPQVVFDKNSPKGCFLIEHVDPENDDTRNDKYVVYGHEGKRGYKALTSKEKFKDAVEWCEKNFRQYQQYYRWNS